jgi:hypothetical protein
MAELETDLLRPHGRDSDDGTDTEDSDVVDMGGYTIAKEPPVDIYAHVGDYATGVVTD